MYGEVANIMLQGKLTLGTVAYMGGVMALPEKFCWSWGQMIQYNTEYLCQQGEIVHYDRATASFHSYARNELVKRFHGDWLLMLDTDHSFEPDLVVRMDNIMNRHDIDVLTGLYQYKSAPHAPVLYWHDEPGMAYSPLGGWDKDKGIQAIECKSAGAGCLMVRRSVYERIENELDEGPFDIIHPFSEDHSFFRRLEKLDIKAYFAPEIHSYHLAISEITLDDYDTNAVSLGDRSEAIGVI